MKYTPLYWLNSVNWQQLRLAPGTAHLTYVPFLAMIKSSILPRPQLHTRNHHQEKEMEKEKEMERKGDLVCHQVLRAKKMKKNLIILYIVEI